MFEENLIQYNNKKPNMGDETLIPHSEWGTPDDILGGIKILESPIMEKAFEKILDSYTPKHRVAFLSLCTVSRPYNVSRKWNTFIKYFSSSCDLIVCSDGGIIPRDYWNCYPYLTYDGGTDWVEGEKLLYKEVGFNRLCKFFGQFKDYYDTIIFNFRPNLPFREVAEKFSGTELGKNFNIKILPTQETYDRAKERGFNHSMMFPDLDDYVMDELKEAIGIVPQKSNPVPSRKVLW